MSTRAAIAIWNEDETITAIYCHNDGYPEYTGRILAEHYTDESKVQALLKLGSISQLRPKLKPAKGTKHTFDDPQKDVTIAYHRDRKEPLCAARLAARLRAAVFILAPSLAIGILLAFVVTGAPNERPHIIQRMSKKTAKSLRSTPY